MAQRMLRRPDTLATAHQSGNQNDSISSTNRILHQFGSFCTAAATNSNDLAHLAARTGDATLVCLALHLERISRDLHAIGQVLPSAVMLAMAESGYANG